MSEISRRTVAKGIAWTAPAIAVAAVVPRAAASPCRFDPSDPSTVLIVEVAGRRCQGSQTVFGLTVTLDCPECSLVLQGLATADGELFTQEVFHTDTAFSYWCTVNRTSSGTVIIDVTVSCGADVFSDVRLLANVELCRGRG